MMAADTLEVLLPGATPAELDRARRMLRFARLLASGATAPRAAAVDVDLGRARGELERQDRLRLEAALRDLLRWHLGALVDEDGFGSPGEPGMELQAAWDVLGGYRGEQASLAGVPRPGESALATAERLLESLATAGAPPAEVEAWRARLEWMACGPRAAEARLRPLLEAAPVALEVAEVFAACLLERGAAGEARAWLESHPGLLSAHARLRRLLAWARVALGDARGAEDALAGLGPCEERIPRRLVELRERRPEWLHLLSGRAPRAVPAGPSSSATARARERAAAGASALVVFAFDAAQGARAVAVDAAPALRRRIDAWIEARDGSHAVPGAAEHELVLSARVRIVQRGEDQVLSDALGGASTRALALAPVLDDDGEVAGWIHLEFEHHLHPSTASLLRLACAWREEVLEARGPLPRADDAARVAPACEPAECRSGRVFEELLRTLRIKTAQRRWWGFVVEDGAARCVASGGEGEGFSERLTGQRRSLARAQATGGAVLFEEPDVRLAVDQRSGSGIALPLSGAGRVCGVLAIESLRRRDFPEADVGRLRGAVEPAGLALCAARFRDDHLHHFGHDVWIDVERSSSRLLAEDLLVASRARSPLVISGEAGTGKSVLARWAHLERASRSGPLVVVEARACPSPDALPGETRGGTLLVEGIEDLAVPAQLHLLHQLERLDADRSRADAPGGRLLFTCRTGLSKAVEDGRLRADLAQRLDRLELHLPPLSHRREDILPLLDCLCRRFSERESVGLPNFDEGALALLWRQPWPGNVRQLESLAYKLVLLRRGAEPRGSPLSAAEIHAIAGRFGMRLLQRIPSRHPARHDLIAALRTTRTCGGRANKTRAAAFLGWDPDTLVARLEEAHIDPEDLEAAERSAGDSTPEPP